MIQEHLSRLSLLLIMLPLTPPVTAIFGVTQDEGEEVSSINRARKETVKSPPHIKGKCHTGNDYQ